MGTWNDRKFRPSPFTLRTSSILTMRWLSFLSPVSHGQKIHSPWTSSVVRVLAIIPPSSHPYPRHPRWFLQHWCSQQDLFLPSRRWLGEFGHACRLLLPPYENTRSVWPRLHEDFPPVCSNTLTITGSHEHHLSFPVFACLFIYYDSIMDLHSVSVLK